MADKLLEKKVYFILLGLRQGRNTVGSCTALIIELINERESKQADATRRYVSDLYMSFGYPVLGVLEERARQER